MKTIQDVYSRGLGGYAINGALVELISHREKSILDSKDCCHFPHNLNRDCDFYISDSCISYYSPTMGFFTYDNKLKMIVN